MHDPAIAQVNQTFATPSPPPGILIADHFVQPFGYFSTRPQGTRDWLLTVTRQGSGCYRVGGIEFLCGAGDVVLLQPGTAHDYATAQSNSPWDFYWVHFTPRPTWSRWLQLPELAPGLRQMKITNSARWERLEHVFQRLLADSRGMGEWQDELTTNALEEVLILVAQEHFKSTVPAIDQRIESVLQAINQHFRQPLTVAELAQQVALSPSRLAHLFKAETGESIMEMVLRLRLRQAARLLEFSSLSLDEIASEVGFHSQFYFSRQFRVFFGRSPSEYRVNTTTDLENNR